MTNLLGDAGKKLRQCHRPQHQKPTPTPGPRYGAVTSRPTLLANWRVEPNVAGVNLVDTNVSAAGLKVNVNGQLRPIIDKMVAEQIATMQQRVRSNPIIEQTARTQ